MSIVSITLLANLTSSTDRESQREYTAIFRVQTSSLGDGPATVRDAAGLPALSSPYDLRAFGCPNEYDGTSILDKKSPVRETGNRLYWLVTCQYRSPDAGTPPKPDQPDNNDQRTNNPLLWRVDVQESWLSRMEAMDEAINVDDIGQRNAGTVGPVVNTAGTAFVPPPEIDHQIKVVKVTKNFARYPSEANNFQQPMVNSKLIVRNYPAGYTLNIPQYKGKMLPWTGKLAWSPDKTTNGVFVPGFSYWQMTQEMHIDLLRGWHKRFLNQGLDRKQGVGDPDGHGGTLSGTDIKPGMAPTARIKDAKGAPISKPVPLDKQGQPLAAGADAIYLEYKWFDESDWSGSDWSN